ncbi:MAG: hypothetical protein ACJ74H_00100 [Thermoanaerobaculia bacterium]
MNATRLTVFILLLACAAPIFGERLPERYERVLVPVLPVGRWAAPLWIRNDGPETVDMFPLVTDADSPSRGRRFPLVEPGLPAGRTFSFRTLSSVLPAPGYIPLTTTFAGAVLYVERGKRQNVRFQLSVQGTQIPVVPEEDFVAAPMSLLMPRIIDGKRYTLRVYSLDSNPGNVEVTFEALLGSPPVSSEVLRLERPNAQALCAVSPCPWPDVPFTPAYAALFFDTTTISSWTERITVTPEPGARIWMFLSESDPVTREVLVQAPN